MLNRLLLQIKQQLSLSRAIALQVFALLLIVLLSQIFNHYNDLSKRQQQIALGLVVQDSHPYIDVLIDSFTKNKDFTAQFNVIIDRRERIVEDFNNHVIDAYLIIPETFTKHLLSYQKNRLNIYTHLGFPTKAKVLRALFTTYSNYVQASNAATLAFYDLLENSTLSNEEIERANQQFSIEMIGIALSRSQIFNSQAVDALAGISSLQYFLVAINLALVGFALIPIVDKTHVHLLSTVMQRLMVTGIPTLQIVCELHMIHVISALSTCALLAWALAIAVGINALFFGLALILSAVIWSVLWLGMALLTRSRQLYFIVSTISAILLALVGGSLTPFTIMPLYLKQFAILSPIYAMSKLALTPSQPNASAWWWMLIVALLVVAQVRRFNLRTLGAKQ